MRSQRLERQNAGMGTPVNWDFALELSGTTPDELPMEKLADYLAHWANLLGVEHKPVYKGAVKGSAVLRASVAPLDRVATSVRLGNAANDESTRSLLDAIEGLMARDGLRRAQIKNRDGRVLQVVRVTPAVPELTVTDRAEIDGRVYRLSGKDNTTSVGLTEDITDRVISVETSSDELARRFAQQFKGALLRVSVKGTWTRAPNGEWLPKRLTAEHFEVLEDVPLLDTMRALRDAPGNGWNRMSNQEAMSAWHDLHYGPPSKVEDVE